jgi:GNAT superfamily N-acetyltransferase
MGLTAPQPLAPDHEVEAFTSGVSELDTWLKKRARLNEKTGASRTFVLCDGRIVVGYYSLATASILHAVATGNVRRNMPEPIPAVLIGRLALDKSIQGKGHGVGLLQDAVLRIAGASQTIGIRAILVHAKSDDAKAFYERFGFRPSPIEPMTLMLTIEEVLRNNAH